MIKALWTLAEVIAKVQDDLDLHAEDFVTFDDLRQFVLDAVDDAEELIIDCFSDFLLTFRDLEVAKGQTQITLPEDLYESRLRGMYFSESGFDGAPMGISYKLRRLSLERITDVTAGDDYRYRLINKYPLGQRLYVYPAIRSDSSTQIRMWYIRQFSRPHEPTDTIEKGLRIQYVLCHVKCAVMQKAGDAMLEAELAKLAKQEDKLKNSLSRLTDDDEDVYLEPDNYALEEAYGIEY